MASEDPLESVPKLALAFLTYFVGDVRQPLHVGRGGDPGYEYQAGHLPTVRRRLLQVGLDAIFR